MLPGVYEHYKSTKQEPKLYRVLFVALFWGTHRDQVHPDSTLYVTPNDDRVGLLPSAVSKSFMTALWSGNTNDVRADDQIVVYVALYGDGRVSARTMKEFNEYIGPVPRFQRVLP